MHSLRVQLVVFAALIGMAAYSLTDKPVPGHYEERDLTMDLELL